MDLKLLKYVPNSKQDAIRDIYKDQDGFWICLHEGWNADRTDLQCRTIHEDTIQALRYQIAGIEKIK